jgi:hypothetical protein
MAFAKEKTITVTVDDFIDRRALYHTEFSDKDGKPCLIQVVPDEYCDSPRQWGNLWTWVTASGAGYSDIKRETPDDFEDDDGKLSKAFLRDNIVVPLYLYRHSGDSISLGREYPFDCPWDSGCMGFAYLSYAKIQEEYGWKNITKTRREKLIADLKGEVETMNVWLSGGAYGIKVVNMESGYEDSCWGFVRSGMNELADCASEMLIGWIDDNDKRHEVAGRLAA